jgi:mono/diheme cytochrome c family protein
MKNPLVLISISMLILSGCEVGDPEQRMKALHMPPPDFKGNAIQGETAYQKNCMACHGSRLEGSDQGPPLLHKVYLPAHHSDFAFHMAARDGVKQHHWHFGDMPAQPNLTPEEMGHIITFVRREQRRVGIK